LAQQVIDGAADDRGAERGEHPVPLDRPAQPGDVSRRPGGRVEPGSANLIVIEGHKRLTGLLLCPQWLPAELDVLLGITASHHK